MITILSKKQSQRLADIEQELVHLNHGVGEYDRLNKQILEANEQLLKQLDRANHTIEVQAPAIKEALLKVAELKRALEEQRQMNRHLEAELDRANQGKTLKDQLNGRLDAMLDKSPISRKR